MSDITPTPSAALGAADDNAAEDSIKNGLSKTGSSTLGGGSANQSRVVGGEVSLNPQTPQMPRPDDPTQATTGAGSALAQAKKAETDDTNRDDTNNSKQDTNNGATIGITLKSARRRWRYEVLANGKYWMWRRGSRKKRESQYGGKFAQLPEMRKVEYGQNREIYHKRREAAKARRYEGDRVKSVRERAILHA